MELTESELLDRVWRGVELLNEKRPDWIGEISVGPLDLAEAEWCILGQLYGDYLDGAIALKLSRSRSDYGCYCCSEDSISRGFSLPGGETARYPALTEAWEQVITALRHPRVWDLTGWGWFLSRDGLTLINPRTGAVTPADDDSILEYPSNYAPGVELDLRASF